MQIMAGQTGLDPCEYKVSPLHLMIRVISIGRIVPNCVSRRHTVGIPQMTRYYRCKGETLIAL